MSWRPSARAALACAALTTVAGTAGAGAQAPTFTQVGAIHVEAHLVEVDGPLAYVVAGKTLHLFDISNPASPVARGSHAFAEKIWGIRIVGSTVYVAADFAGLGILDVSNPASPLLKGLVKTPGQAKNVAVVGTTALVADHMTGVDVIDVSNPAAPVIAGSYFLEGYARDVVSRGSIAYAIDAPAGVYVFDLSRPGPVEPVTSQQSARAPGSIVVADGSGTRPPLAVMVGGGLVQVYDLSKPLEPARIAAFKTPSGRPSRATLHGQYAYVADGREGLQVLDLATPSAPVLLGTGLRTPEPARDVAVTGSGSDTFVYVAVGAGEEGGEVLILRRQ